MLRFSENQKVGRLVFILLWPLIFIYAPFRARVRVIVIHEKQILVVKDWLSAGGWQLPGGGMERRETIMQTAIREIKEELDFQLDNDNSMVINEKPMLVMNQGLPMRFNYVVSTSDILPNIKAKQDEITDFSWVTLENLKIPDTVRSQLLRHI